MNLADFEAAARAKLPPAHWEHPRLLAWHY
jgi:hypothetical protein